MHIPNKKYSFFADRLFEKFKLQTNNNKTTFKNVTGLPDIFVQTTYKKILYLRSLFRKVSPANSKLFIIIICEVQSIVLAAWSEGLVPRLRRAGSVPDNDTYSSPLSKEGRSSHLRWRLLNTFLDDTEIYLNKFSHI